MIQAIWQNTVIAQTKTFEPVEGNRYFPASSLVLPDTEVCSRQHLGPCGVLAWCSGGGST